MKRTALGRIKHEDAAPAVAPDGRVVIYMGDDEQFNYVYKFVSRDPWNPSSRATNTDVLDNGTLYVAQFSAGGAGRWIALVFGQNGLDAAGGFTSQADVLIRTRQAADRVGATRMDRPEWIAVSPTNRDVYLTLTNNPARTATGANAVRCFEPAGGQLVRPRRPLDRRRQQPDGRFVPVEHLRHGGRPGERHRHEAR